MWCALLSISDISTVLIILGGLQISAVLIALLVLLLPVLLLPSEPRVRMLKWILPRRAHLWSFRHVLLTKIVNQQYPKSVSEYSGARGSSQHQMLSAITTTTGTLQVTIAFCLWVADEADIAKMLVLIFAGVCCVMIGQMESALPWKNVINELEIVKAYLQRYRQLQKQHHPPSDERAAGGDLPIPGTGGEERAAAQPETTGDGQSSHPPQPQPSQQPREQPSAQDGNGHSTDAEASNGMGEMGEQPERKEGKPFTESLQPAPPSSAPSPQPPAAPSSSYPPSPSSSESSDSSASASSSPVHASGPPPPSAGSPAAAQRSTPTGQVDKRGESVIVQRDRQSGEVQVKQPSIPDLTLISNLMQVKDEEEDEQGRGHGPGWMPEPPLFDFYGRDTFQRDPDPAGLPLYHQLTDEKQRRAFEAFIKEKHRTRALANLACSGSTMRYISPQYTRIVPLRPLDIVDFNSTEQLQARHRRVDQWQIFIPPRNDDANPDHEGADHTSDVSHSSHADTWQPAQADGMALRLVGREGGGHKDRPTVHDNRVKANSSIVHMAAALCFVVLNFIAEGVLGSAAQHRFRPEADQSRTDISAALAFLGLFLFLLFSALSWLSGGYDDLLGNGGRGPLSCCMAREVAPSLVCYQQYPGHSGVQVGPIERGEEGPDSFIVRPRSCCAFASCPSFCWEGCKHQQFAVDERAYHPNWYDRYYEVEGERITDCICSDWGQGGFCQWLSRCSLRWCVHATCCCRRKKGAALVGIGFILLETGAFALLVVSVAVEAVNIAIENPQFND